ncbi:MAG: 4-hydroxy-tetrahydrodipicolinate reductase [Clostridia bacterium]|nr:4-hydroxy-tetrahydrodipicolinate reductase [Clostridia bacterium]
MVNILLNGCNGKMGQVISRFAKEYDDIEIIAGVDINNDKDNSYPVVNDISNMTSDVDVVIDFSHPSAFDKVLDYCLNKKTAVVMATTGLSETQKQQLKKASNEIPVFFSANMSLGVNLMIALCNNAAKFLEGKFDIEIIEKHHNQKVDAPSGTALAIADSINTTLDDKMNYVYNREPERKKRETNEIGIHSVRGGSIVGEHSVIFAGQDEIIEIKHEALSKDIFARGALKAALYMKDKPKGFYNMDSMIKAQ